MRISLRVNGVECEADCWEGESLLFALREKLGFPGSKNACLDATPDGRPGHYGKLRLSCTRSATVTVRGAGSPVCAVRDAYGTVAAIGT